MLYTFFYHTVSDENLAFAKNLYPIKSTKQFEDDLAFLVANFQPIQLAQLKNWKTISKPSFLLTFDDGLRQVGEVIAPLLLKKGIPAIFFVNKSFALHQSVFYKHQISFLKEQVKDSATWSELDKVKFRESEKIKTIARNHQIDMSQLKSKDLYLSKNELESLSEKGFLIGAHSVNHPHFQEIEEKEQLRQVGESMEWVTEKFHPSISTFAFPFEDYFLKKSFFERMNQLAFAPKITFGTSEGKEDVIPNSIQRIDAEAGGLPLEVIFKNHKRKRLLRKLVFKNKLNRT